MKKNAILIRLAAAALVLSGGCTTNPAEEVHYVNVSQAACSFLGEGSKPLAIVVDAAPAQWTAEPGASWVKVEIPMRLPLPLRWMTTIRERSGVPILPCRRVKP